MTVIIALHVKRADYPKVHKFVLQLPWILECHHVSGRASFLIKAAVPNVAGLETLIEHLGRLGETTTSLGCRRWWRSCFFKGPNTNEFKPVLELPQGAPVQPMEMCDQPACEAGSRRGGPSSRTGQECLGFFERGDGGLAADRREVIEELIQAITRLEIVDQRIDGHAGSAKARSAAQDLWTADDDRFALHGEPLDFQSTKNDDPYPLPDASIWSFRSYMLFNNPLKQEVLPSLGSCPVDSAELWVSSNFHIRPVVTQLEDRTVHFVPKCLVLAQTKIRELAGEIMRQVVAMFPEGLDCTDIIGVESFHEITEVEQAFLELIVAYHAGQFTLNHRFAHGVSAMVGYTFSKELDNLVAPRNPYNTALEKAPGAVNRPHVMNATFVYLLPFGADRKFKSGHGAVNQIVGGWQLSGVVNAASGAPLIITATNCQSGNILGTCYRNYNPSFSGDARINGNFGDGNVATTPYLNKAAFVVPAPYTVGNVARGAALGLNVSHTTNFDLSVHRDFKIREHWRLSLQSDAFNILNSVYFGAPGANIDAASFGLVTSQSNLPRRLQLSARIMF